ncbi:hypothetical protein [Nonomuraea zeae]|uniref:hypothetical protein n=1 Tax=Nonomuraea zeae TaxID=1642303 RepID=UPI00361E9D86
MNDPFADEAQAAKPAAKSRAKAKTKEKPLTETAESPYTGTFKAGGGFDAPWLVVRASSAADYRELLEAADAEGLFELTAEKAKEFAAKYGPPAKGNSSARSGSSKPAARKSPKRSAAPEDPPTCDCGDEAGYTEFQSKAGKDIKAWKCQRAIDDYRDESACEFFQWAN